MSFSRKILPKQFAIGDALSKDMAGLGFIITAEMSVNPNIENTLIAVSIEGLRGDYRSLSLLVNWLEIHQGSINADRLIRMILQLRKDKLLLSFWSACAKNVMSDSRFRRLLKFNSRASIDLLNVGTDFQISRFGEDPRFEKTCLRIPANLLRNRPRDILPPERLAAVHSVYRYRIMIGPSYRADQWAILDKLPETTSSELARKSFSSFGAAWQAKQDFEILRKITA